MPSFIREELTATRGTIISGESPFRQVLGPFYEPRYSEVANRRIGVDYSPSGTLPEKNRVTPYHHILVHRPEPAAFTLGQSGAWAVKIRLPPATESAERVYSSDRTIHVWENGTLSAPQAHTPLTS